MIEMVIVFVCGFYFGMAFLAIFMAGRRPRRRQAQVIDLTGVKSRDGHVGIVRKTW